MPVIQYDYAKGSKAIIDNQRIIEQRYSDLKQKMTNRVILNQIRRDKIKRIQTYLSVLNKAYAHYSPDKLEKMLIQNTEKKLGQDLTIYLEQMAKNSSGLLENNIAYQPNKTGLQQDSFFTALSSLYSLYELGRNKKEISIDMASFESEYFKIAQSFLKAKGKLKETGNALGYIGALSGAVVAQNTLVDLMDSLKAKNKNTRIYNVGSKKINNSKQTITTDTLVVTSETTSSGANVQAYLRISDKFNSAYRRNATSTVKPVKLATRTIAHFLNEIDDIRIRNAYDNAIMNYLSYHAYYEPHFTRVDFLTKNLFKDDWKKFRRAVGAEIIHSEIFGPGKGSFDFQGMQVQDQIDLYIYGDKIFLADDIIKSLKTERGDFKDFNMAQISLAKRAKILRNTTRLQGALHNEIINAPRPKENRVRDILLTSSITYRQVIKFI